MGPVEILDLLILEVTLWQWIAMTILSIIGWIIWFQVFRLQMKPVTKKKLPQSFEYEFSAPMQKKTDESTQQATDLEIDDSEIDEVTTTSIGAELYNKKLGLILLFVSWVWRYPIGIHFPDLWIKSAWQFHAAMGVLVGAIWLYGILRHNKRSYIDHVVNSLLILWAFLLFLVQGELL